MLTSPRINSLMEGVRAIKDRTATQGQIFIKLSKVLASGRELLTGPLCRLQLIFRISELVLQYNTVLYSRVLVSDLRLMFERGVRWIDAYFNIGRSGCAKKLLYQWLQYPIWLPEWSFNLFLTTLQK